MLSSGYVILARFRCVCSLRFPQIQIKYCKRDDAQIRGFCNEYEEMWGARIPVLIAAATAPRVEQRVSHSFPGAQTSTRLLPPAASSQMYPLGRSLDELRLHNQDNSWSNMPHSHPQLGMGSGLSPVGASGDNVKRASSEGEGDSSSKNAGGRLGESLPSLKSSGLLDSWNSTKTQGAHSRTISSAPPLGTGSDARPTALSGMPVGLQWLANESR